MAEQHRAGPAPPAVAQRTCKARVVQEADATVALRAPVHILVPLVRPINLHGTMKFSTACLVT